MILSVWMNAVIKNQDNAREKLSRFGALGVLLLLGALSASPELRFSAAG